MELSLSKFSFFSVADVFILIFHMICRLEALNDKRSIVVQMVKLAEKERDSLEV